MTPATPLEKYTLNAIRDSLFTGSYQDAVAALRAFQLQHYRERLKEEQKIDAKSFLRHQIFNLKRLPND
jgi:hypothetical protein